VRDMDKDITDEVKFQLNDDECLPLTRCACGVEFLPWDFIIGVYKDMPAECSNCKRRMYFTVSIKVFEVEKK